MKENKCTCLVDECDCEAPDAKIPRCSMECPIHNLYPQPREDCPVHGWLDEE